MTAAQKRVIKAMREGRTINKHIARTPYFHINYFISKLDTDNLGRSKRITKGTFDYLLSMNLIYDTCADFRFIDIYTLTPLGKEIKID